MVTDYSRYVNSDRNIAYGSLWLPFIYLLQWPVLKRIDKKHEHIISFSDLISTIGFIYWSMHKRGFILDIWLY